MGPQFIQKPCTLKAKPLKRVRGLVQEHIMARNCEGFGGLELEVAF